MLQIAFAVVGLVTMLLTASSSVPLLIGLCFLLGLSEGCFITLLGPIVACDLDLAPSSHGQAMGSLLALCALPNLFGPLVAGELSCQNSGIKFIARFRNNQRLVGRLCIGLFAGWLPARGGGSAAIPHALVCENVSQAIRAERSQVE